ncbi:hypothetical protein GCM10025783_32710 [Amnibacterium soli]|uniref:Uncharacterized protein n=1 Tax=Amnibacterium soli TaxID=1282736 RepID=A0ABP8ZH86_9MICO
MESLPKNVWWCDAPGMPGNTIGSSFAKWLTVQVAWNSGTFTGAWRDTVLSSRLRDDPAPEEGPSTGPAA